MAGLLLTVPFNRKGDPVRHAEKQIQDIGHPSPWPPPENSAFKTN